MSPGYAILNVADGGGAHSICTRDYFNGPSVLTYLWNLENAEFARPAATFAISVARVFTVSAEPKMRRVTAARIIACVANAEVARLSVFCQYPCDARRYTFMFADTKHAITPGISLGCPWPALIVATAFDLRPKATVNWFRNVRYDREKAHGATPTFRRWEFGMGCGAGHLPCQPVDFPRRTKREEDDEDICGVHAASAASLEAWRSHCSVRTVPPVARSMRCARSRDGRRVPPTIREMVATVVSTRAAKSVCFSFVSAK